MAEHCPSAQDFILLLREKLEANGDLARAAQTAAYLKDQFVLFGITQGVRRILFRDFLKQHGSPSSEHYAEYTRLLMEQEEREFHYCAIELASKYVRKAPELDLYLEMIQTKSWWDSVDTINSLLIMPYLRTHSDDVGSLSLNWAKSESIWLKRISIICQLKSKGSTQTEVLFRNIKLNLDSKEFFIQKAIGWALRELSKTQPKLVESFVKSNKLRTLSEREAMRIILKTQA